jgi:hypothetical protein
VSGVNAGKNEIAETDARRKNTKHVAILLAGALRCLDFVLGDVFLWIQVKDDSSHRRYQ